MGAHAPGDGNKTAPPAALVTDTFSTQQMHQIPGFKIYLQIQILADNHICHVFADTDTNGYLQVLVNTAIWERKFWSICWGNAKFGQSFLKGAFWGASLGYF